MFMPNIYCLYFNSICKNINVIFSCRKCHLCDNNFFLPIEVENKLYCYDCYDIQCLKIRYTKFDINKSDLETWKYLDRCRKKPYLNCKHCKLKCSALDFAHYHLLYRCDDYVHNIEKLIGKIYLN
uniref:Uncharacterized protein n=1 Tax=viral metagenome TaxID=1070528 RepID=A0A6C0LE16_9ZZZZ